MYLFQADGLIIAICSCLFFLASAQYKNFEKENVHRIKEIQKANREKQRESTTTEPVKAVYKPGKFDHVDSKVAQEIKVKKDKKKFYLPLAVFIAQRLVGQSKSMKQIIQVKHNKFKNPKRQEAKQQAWPRT